MTKTGNLNFNYLKVQRNMNFNSSFGRLTKITDLRFPKVKVSLLDVMMEKEEEVIVNDQNLVVKGAKSVLQHKMKFPGTQTITVLEVGVSGLPSLPCLDMAA